MGKIRCPLRPQSMTLDRDRPEILTPPEHPQACCTRQTLTVPADVNAKTRQKHDYPSAAWRRSYARRTGAERGFATAKDPATNDIARGWCRLMGLAPLMLFVTTLLVVRNQRILTSWNARQEENQRRPAPENPHTAPHDPRRPRRQTPLTPTATTTSRARHQHPHHTATGRQHARRQHKPGLGPAGAPEGASTAHPGPEQPERQTRT